MTTLVRRRTATKVSELTADLQLWHTDTQQLSQQDDMTAITDTHHDFIPAAHRPDEIMSAFLASVVSERRSLYAIARPSVVCRSSVTFVRCTQAVQIVGNISTALGTMAIRWHSLKILRRSSPGNPFVGGVKHKRVAKYSDFGRIDGYISETVQDRR